MVIPQKTHKGISMRTIINLNIRKIMEARGLTPRDIEPIMNISARSIYRILENQKIPNLTELYYFSKVLKVNIDELYTITEIDESLIKCDKLEKEGTEKH